MCVDAAFQFVYLLQVLRQGRIVALGQFAHTATLAALGLKKSARPFKHAAVHDLGEGLPWLANSYHCSRYNQNTGRLTVAMFDAVIADMARRIA